MPKTPKPKHIHDHHHKDDSPPPIVTPPVTTTPGSLDLSHIMLQINDEQGKLLYVKPPALATFSNKYFSNNILTVNSNETPIVKKGGCRTEFRELNLDGSNAAWDTLTKSKLVVTLSINELPLPNKTIVFAQIKNEDKECQLVLQDQLIYLRQFNVNHQTIKSNYILGTKFSFTISTDSDTITVSLDDGATLSFTDSQKDCYFKFGNYQQPNLTTGIIENQTSIVQIYSFSITH